MKRIQQETKIKVFGEEAKAIHEGEIFIASVGSVEGRKVVTLKQPQVFEGETNLHIGKKHTFNHIADAVLKRLTAVEAKCLITILEKNMKEPKFLKSEAKFQEFVAKFKKEQEMKH